MIFPIATCLLLTVLPLGIHGTVVEVLETDSITSPMPRIQFEEHTVEEHSASGPGHDGKKTKHHTHRRPSSEARAMSISLLGLISFVMSMFYLVNFRDPDIVIGTWKMLNATLSIFGAVLLYGMLKMLLLDALSYAGFHLDTLGEATFGLMLFLALYVSLQITLFRAKKKEQEMFLIAEGIIFAHVTGFAASVGFASLQEAAPFRGSLWGAASVVFIAILVLSVLMFVCGTVRQIFERRGATRGEIMRYEENVEDAEHDIVSLCLGFLIMQVVRYWICGFLPSHEPTEEPKGISQAFTWTLLICSLFFGVLTVVLVSVVNHVLKVRIHNHTVIRYISMCCGVSSMTFAWCLLFWAEWQIYCLGFDGARISGAVFVALLLSCLSLCMIFVVDYIADRLEVRHGERSIRALILAFGALVGVGWEKSFDIAIEDAAHSGAFLGIPPNLTMYIVGLLLCAIVLPAWRVYILPNSIQEHHEQHSESNHSESNSVVELKEKI